jgi:hypothetical protein
MEFPMFLRSLTFILLFSATASLAKDLPFKPGGPLTLAEIHANEIYNHLAALLNTVGDPEPAWNSEMLADYEKNLATIGKLRLQLRDGGDIGIALMTQSAKLMKARAEKRFLETATYVNAAYKLELENYTSLLERYLDMGYLNETWTKEKALEAQYLLNRLLESTIKLLAMDRAYPEQFGKFLDSDTFALIHLNKQQQMFTNLLKDKIKPSTVDEWLAKIKGLLQ